jgi:hypothetical protein
MTTAECKGVCINKPVQLALHPEGGGTE